MIIRSNGYILKGAYENHDVKMVACGQKFTEVTEFTGIGFSITLDPSFTTTHEWGE
mgnify:CR=1 FL=1